MQATVQGGATLGIRGILVHVEADVANGLPNFLIVGLPDTAVQESKERVRAALRNSGFDPPGTRVTVNLAPGDLRKAGPGFDLPIAIGLLAASEALPGLDLRRYLFLGELALDGSLRRVSGVLPIAVEARRRGMKLVVPAANATEALLVAGLEVLPFEALGEVVAYLRDPGAVAPAPPGKPPAGPSRADLPDLSDIKGQDSARRALEIAAAGGHNLLLIGPPGSGKSMLARRMPSIMPPLTDSEALEVTAIYSVGGLLETRGALERRPPFRSPHHSISPAGLVGGSSSPRPGEVSLAHRGVLFLDELGEFSRSTLEVLRQPIEDRRVVISRARASVAFPSDFALAAAMNPCPCGYSGDRVRVCICSQGAVSRYWSRISGPLVDRLDLHVEVPRLEAEEIVAVPRGEASAAVRDRVLEARMRQGRRFKGGRIVCNSQLAGRDLLESCRLDAAGQDVLSGAIRRLGLTARTYDRVLKVARTVADLAGRDAVTSADLKEALQLRALDVK